MATKHCVIVSQRSEQPNFCYTPAKFQHYLMAGWMYLVYLGEKPAKKTVLGYSVAKLCSGQRLTVLWLSGGAECTTELVTSC